VAKLVRMICSVLGFVLVYATYEECNGSLYSWLENHSVMAELTAFSTSTSRSSRDGSKFSSSSIKVLPPMYPQSSWSLTVFFMNLSLARALSLQQKLRVSFIGWSQFKDDNFKRCAMVASISGAEFRGDSR